MVLSDGTMDRIKRLMPRSGLCIIRSRQLRAEQSNDRRRYMSFSSSVTPEKTQDNLKAWITMLYHNIEKGLSLPDPRPRFGAARVERLLNYVSTYRSKYGDDQLTSAAAAALSAYGEFNLSRGIQIKDVPGGKRIEELIETLSTGQMVGGALSVERSTVDGIRAGVSLEFFTSRSSVRQFSSEPVRQQDIDFAIAAAIKSPAVCNRQFGRVYVSLDRGVIDEALTIQGGARGFAKDVPAIAVITTSVASYWNAGERMQPWTDGGMFAMSFILGLHASGLGSVCLNWSKTRDVDARFRRTFNIPEDRVIVMIVAFGNLRNTYKVAASPRIASEEALQVLDFREQRANGAN